MTRKDYIAIANVINRLYTYEHQGRQYVDKRFLIIELAGCFAEDNPNFDLDRFTTACNLNNLG